MAPATPRDTAKLRPLQHQIGVCQRHFWCAARQRIVAALVQVTNFIAAESFITNLSTPHPPPPFAYVGEQIEGVFDVRSFRSPDDQHSDATGVGAHSPTLLSNIANRESHLGLGRGGPSARISIDAGARANVKDGQHCW